MSNEYIDKEVDKVVNQAGFEHPQNLAMATAWILGNFKGLNLKVLEVKRKSSLADYFVMGSATNITQAQSMAQEISYQLKKHGQKILSKEGLNSDWILIDAGDILVHIFQDSTRSIYDLDGLWSDSTQVEIPQDYYFSSDQREGIAVTTEKDASDKDFF